MISLKHFVVTAALAALAACADNPSSGEPAADLSKKTKVVTFDVSGMT
jgi:hypothetical protein